MNDVHILAWVEVLDLVGRYYMCTMQKKQQLTMRVLKMNVYVLFYVRIVQAIGAFKRFRKINRIQRAVNFHWRISLRWTYIDGQ